MSDYREMKRYIEDRLARGLDVPELDGAEVLALIAENEALRKDAERYRWVRSQNVGHCEINRTLFETITDDCNPPYRGLKFGADLDSAIDEAASKEKASV